MFNLPYDKEKKLPSRAALPDNYMQVLLNMAENKFSVDEVMDILGGRREK